MNRRLPLDTRKPGQLAIALIGEFTLLQAFVAISMLFLVTYISILTYFRPIIDDMSSILELQSKSIEDRISSKKEFVEFIRLHKDLYEYSISSFYLLFLFNIFTHLACVTLPIDIRLLERFEPIVTLPLFLQFPVFGIMLAVMLYQIEHVS